MLGSIIVGEMIIRKSLEGGVGGKEKGGDMVDYQLINEEEVKGGIIF